jgi:thymidylate synthase
MALTYIPYGEREPDGQYAALLRRIAKDGERVFPQQDEPARMIVGPQLVYDLRNGFPIVTERDLVTPGEKSGTSAFTSALAELAAFLNGARTQTELERFGVTWWKRWVTPEKCAKRGLPPGDLGPGSYGPAFRTFPTLQGTPFDQITNILEQIREFPHLRTHFVSPWIPQYIGRGKGKTQKVVVVPCHGWFHVLVYPETGCMDLHHFQRSGDIPVGVVANLIQYAALLMTIAQVTGYTPRRLHYTISDAHIYEGQFTDVARLLETEPQRLPTVTLDPTVNDLFAVRPSHFTVADYHPQRERMVIWTPV